MPGQPSLNSECVEESLSGCSKWALRQVDEQPVGSSAGWVSLANVLPNHSVHLRTASIGVKPAVVKPNSKVAEPRPSKCVRALPNDAEEIVEPSADDRWVWIVDTTKDRGVCEVHQNEEFHRVSRQ